MTTYRMNTGELVKVANKRLLRTKAGLIKYLTLELLEPHLFVGTLELDGKPPRQTRADWKTGSTYALTEIELQRNGVLV